MNNRKNEKENELLKIDEAFKKVGIYDVVEELLSSEEAVQIMDTVWCDTVEMIFKLPPISIKERIAEKAKIFNSPKFKENFKQKLKEVFKMDLYQRFFLEDSILLSVEIFKEGFKSYIQDKKNILSKVTILSISLVGDVVEEFILLQEKNEALEEFGSLKDKK